MVAANDHKCLMLIALQHVPRPVMMMMMMMMMMLSQAPLHNSNMHRLLI